MARPSERPQRPEPPERFKILRTVVIIIASPIFTILFIVTLAILRLLVLPYTLFYYSAHWGLRKRDFAVVQLYLDHFQALHADLIAHFSRDFSSLDEARITAPRVIRFWPMLIGQADIEGGSPVGIVRTWGHVFSGATALFVCLDGVGFSRKQLYALLQREVEAKVPSLTAEEKANFQRVKDKICENNLYAKLIPTTDPSGFTLPTDAGEKIVVPVRNYAVDWVVEGPGVLVVPMDTRTLACFQRMTRLLPVWKKVETDEDLVMGAEGMWQMVDLR
ncbi:hypothetical protein H2200_009447 [Cladophialophora chaetospira]|uniref:Uncharacterized protein n=1 Tax=Cladophialophora chaetospira TaxID=386627 RepID=A0AA38X464_9EURO|nr:hypothetical protein H2200_009447 [Cladophialophora chaetospira]